MNLRGCVLIHDTLFCNMYYVICVYVYGRQYIRHYIFCISVFLDILYIYILYTISVEGLIKLLSNICCAESSRLVEHAPCDILPQTSSMWSRSFYIFRRSCSMQTVPVYRSPGFRV